MKKIFFLVGLLIFCTLIFVFFQNKGSYQPAKTPDLLPKSSFWAGGPDGGFWFYIEKTNKNLYYIKIYNDTTFKIEYEGWFIGDTYSLAELRKEIDWYDGVYVGLSNSKTLKKIHEVGRKKSNAN